MGETEGATCYESRRIMLIGINEIAGSAAQSRCCGRDYLLRTAARALQIASYRDPNPPEQPTAPMILPGGLRSALTSAIFSGCMRDSNADRIPRSRNQSACRDSGSFGGITS